jgi:hypothetical protein
MRFTKASTVLLALTFAHILHAAGETKPPATSQSASMPASGPSAAVRPDAQVFAERLAEIRTDLYSQLLSSAQPALADGLAREVLAVAREVLAAQPENKNAARLVKQAEDAVKAGVARKPTDAQVNALLHARQTLAKKIGTASKDAAARYAALAEWCAQKHLAAGRSRCLSEAMKLDPDNEPAHQARGEKLVPGFGWVREEVQKKLAGGLWMTNGQWLKWSDVSKARIDALKARESRNLGGGFRYSATHHLTIANNLTDAEYEKDMIEALELCVLDQRTRLFEPFVVGQDKPFNVIVFQNHSEFSAYCTKIESSNGDSMGVYVPERRTLHAWRRGKDFTNGIGTTFHELTHGTSEDYMGSSKTPIWLDEGLASFHEKTRPKGDRMNFGPINIPRMESLQALLAEGKTVTLEELISIDQVKWGHRRMVNYNASAMLMHYLWEHEALQPFIRSFKSSRNAKVALTKALKQDFATTEQQYQAFLREELLDPKALEKMAKQMKGTRQF